MYTPKIYGSLVTDYTGYESKLLDIDMSESAA